MINMKRYNGLLIKIPNVSEWIPASELLKVRVDIIDNQSKKRLGRMRLKDLIIKVG